MTNLYLNQNVSECLRHLKNADDIIDNILSSENFDKLPMQIKLDVENKAQGLPSLISTLERLWNVTK